MISIISPKKGGRGRKKKKEGEGKGQRGRDERKKTVSQMKETWRAGDQLVSLRALVLPFPSILLERKKKRKKKGRKGGEKDVRLPKRWWSRPHSAPRPTFPITSPSVRKKKKKGREKKERGKEGERPLPLLCQTLGLPCATSLALSRKEEERKKENAHDSRSATVSSRGPR